MALPQAGQDPDQDQAQDKAQGQSENPGEDRSEALINMITQIDDSIAKVAQIIGQAIPQAGDALMQIGQQFRSVIQKVMQQGGGQAPQGQQQGGMMQDQMAPMETGGKPAKPAL